MRTRLAIEFGVAVTAAAALLLGLGWKSGTEPSPDRNVADLRPEVAPSDLAAPGIRRTEPSKIGAKSDEPGTAAAGSPTAPSAAAVAEGAPWPSRFRVKADDAPLAGAVVRARLPGEDVRPLLSAKTDAAGLAALDRAAAVARVAERGARVPAEFVFEAYAEGYRVSTTNGNRCATVDDGTLEFELLKGAPFDGKVLDASTSVPIAGASVTARDRGEEDLDVGPTDAHGAFHVFGVMNDNETEVRATAPGHAPGKVSVRIDTGRPQGAGVVVRLEVAGALVGAVRAPDGSPVEGASVWIRPSRTVAPTSSDPSPTASPTNVRLESYEYDDRILELHQRWRPHGEDDEEIRATSGTDGAFRAEGLRFGVEYEATARAPGFASSAPLRDLRATADGTGRPTTLVLRRGATVLVRVGVPPGLATPTTARVRLFLQPDDVMVKPVDANRGADGSYRFVGVDPGRGLAFAQAQGWRSAASAFVAAEGATVETEIVLAVGGAIDGAIVDGDGKPLAGADVSVAPAWRNARSSSRYLSGETKGTTDAQGRFSIGGVPPGDAFIVASWAGEGRTLGTRGRVSVTVPAQGLRLVLLRRGAVRMRLLRPDGKPFAGLASVYYTDPGGGAGKVRWDFDDGLEASSDLDDGEHAILVAPDTYAWVRRSFTIRDGADADLGDVRLETGVSVSGKIVDGAGRPIPGASVTCVENENREAVTDAQGAFEFDRFPREPVTLWARAEGLCATHVAVDPARTSGLEIRLARPATIRGVWKGPPPATKGGPDIVLRPFGAVLMREAGVDISGKPTTFEFYEGAAPFQADMGSFEGEIAPGRWVAWWTDAAGHEHDIGEWTFTDGETRTIELVPPTR